METNAPTTADPAPGKPLRASPNPAADSPAFLAAVAEMAQTQPLVVARAIYNQQGTKLLEAGAAVDGGLYDRLFAHRLAAPLDESMESEDPVTPAALREAAEAALARWPFFALMAPAGRVRGMLLQAIEAILLPPPIAFHLTLARATRPAVFDHGILMALLCAHLVREGGAPVHDMTVAATAGLLHDLGMLHIDAELLAAGNRLSGDQRRPLYAHPVTASMLTARFHAYPTQVPRAILEHHELLDGSGYPRGLVGDAISPLGRLLSLCEVVTAMFDGARERPEHRVSLLLRLNPQRFDATLVPSIHRLLAALPADARGADAGDAAAPVSIDTSVERLLVLDGLLKRWNAAAEVAVPALDTAGRSVLAAMAEQAGTLQRMLFDAGITPEQLVFVSQGEAAEPALCAELAGLGDELHWTLRAAANQLRRRWRSGAGGAPFPPDVAAWLDEVEGLDAGPR